MKFDEKILAIFEEEDIVPEVEEKYITFSFFSPAGQDFSFTVSNSDSMKELAHNIYEYYENFDVSEETYLWLDNTGHGINGAPYDMKDVYEDMEACESGIMKIYRILNSNAN